jgi:hypothetical protein
VGEAKLRHTVDALPLLRSLERKALRLPRRSPRMRYAVAAPRAVEHAPSEVLTVTAHDVFGLEGEPPPRYPRLSHVVE